MPCNSDQTPLFVDAPITHHDAFGRFRVVQPYTIFDSKQIFDNQPLIWDESLETGAGITSNHSVNRASTILTSTLNTAGKFTRQTFMRFNYMPGKGQQIMMTGILGASGGGVGVVRRAGQFDDNNGVFFEDDEGVLKAVCRSNVTGTPVDTKVSQADFNIDRIDGTGASGFNIDASKAQIIVFDYEWLGAGVVRMGFAKDSGEVVYCHEFRNANTIDAVYMSTPNNPLRYQMETQATSAASTLECICSTVITEGGQSNLGITRCASTQGTHVNASTENTKYAVIGLRLKSTHIGETIDLLNASIIEHVGNKSFEWFVVLNPTVAGTFTYSSITDSAIEYATGATANTVTGGTMMTGGFGTSSTKGGTADGIVENALRLGAAIDGTVDEIVLCVVPIGGTSNLDIDGSILWRERQ